MSGSSLFIPVISMGVNEQSDTCAGSYTRNCLWSYVQGAIHPTPCPNIPLYHCSNETPLRKWNRIWALCTKSSPRPPYPAVYTFYAVADRRYQLRSLSSIDHIHGSCPSNWFVILNASHCWKMIYISAELSNRGPEICMHGLFTWRHNQTTRYLVEV